MDVAVEPNAHDRFILQQRIKLVINQYEFCLLYTSDAADE